MEGGISVLKKHEITIGEWKRLLNELMESSAMYEEEFPLEALGERRLYSLFQNADKLLAQLRYSLTRTYSYAPRFELNDAPKKSLDIPVKISVDQKKSLILETIPLPRRGSKIAFQLHCSVEKRLTHYLLSCREKPLIQYPMSIVFMRCLKQFTLHTPDSDNVETNKIASRICAALSLPETKGKVNLIYTASVVGEDFTKIIVTPTQNIEEYLCV